MPLVNIKVITNAKKQEIILEADGSLKIKVTIVPEKGKANKKIIEILAKQLKISKKNITIVSGEFNNNKVVSINDLTEPLGNYF